MFGGGVDGETEATLWRLDATAFGNATSYRGIVAAGDA
jgi:hypothetical protein